MIKNKAKLFEFLTLFTMTVGTVIGSGIYMKNRYLLSDTQNPIIAIILWFIVGIVCMMTVYVFIEIASSTKNFGNGTVGNWTKLFINRKIASFFSILYLVIYVPSSQSVFTAGFVTFFFLAIGKPIPVNVQFTVMLVTGIILMTGFALINGLKQVWADKIQIFATIFKFIPLVIALVAGFILIDTSPNGTSSMWNGGNYPGNAGNSTWSTSAFSAGSFIRGFGAILFAFDGFVYIANKQKDVKNKDVVPMSLVFGMLFVAVFYVLMAISLFLGSPDGSIVKLLEKVFSGGGKISDAGATAARIVANVSLMIICLQGINIFAIIGVRGLESDANAKLMYSKKRNIGYAKAAFMQLILSVTIYVVLIVIGAFIIRQGEAYGISETYDKWLTHTTNPIDDWSDTQKIQAYLGFTGDYITFYVGIMSSTAAAFGFLMVTVMVFAGIVNRFTNKVQVDKVKGFLPIAITAGILTSLFIAFAFFGFLIPRDVLSGKQNWLDSTGFWFFILLFGNLLIAAIYWLIQEKLFKKDPFKGGFDGEIDPNDKSTEFISTFIQEKINNIKTKKTHKKQNKVTEIP